MMAHQNPPYLAFCTLGQNETKNKIQGYQREKVLNANLGVTEILGIHVLRYELWMYWAILVCPSIYTRF